MNQLYLPVSRLDKMFYQYKSSKKRLIFIIKLKIKFYLQKVKDTNCRSIINDFYGYFVLLLPPSSAAHMPPYANPLRIHKQNAHTHTHI